MVSDRCDAGCRRPALTWWTRDPDDTHTAPDLDGWQMCGPCADRLQAGLKVAGYEVWVDEREPVPTS